MNGGDVTVDSISKKYTIEKGMRLTKPISETINGKSYRIFFRIEEDTSTFKFKKDGNDLVCSINRIPDTYPITLPSNEIVTIKINAVQRVVVIRNKGFPLSPSSSQRGLLIINVI